jgi:hypothetical protein
MFAAMVANATAAGGRQIVSRTGSISRFPSSGSGGHTWRRSLFHGQLESGTTRFIPGLGVDLDPTWFSNMRFMRTSII